MKDLQFVVASTLESQASIDAPARRTVIEPIANLFSRRVVMAAHSENIRSVLRMAIKEYYRETSDGRMWNILENGRIEPVPWGRTGYQKWGVRRVYAEAIRHLLLDNQTDDALFVWLGRSRSWYLNLDRYPAEQSALAWLADAPIDAEKIMMMLDLWRDSRRGSSKGSRGGSSKGSRRGSQR